MAKTQAELSQRYFEKHGIKQKKFHLEPETVAYFDLLADKTGKSHVTLLREAMKDLAKKYGVSV